MGKRNRSKAGTDAEHCSTLHAAHSLIPPTKMEETPGEFTGLDSMEGSSSEQGLRLREAVEALTPYPAQCALRGAQGSGGCMSLLVFPSRRQHLYSSFLSSNSELSFRSWEMRGGDGILFGVINSRSSQL